MWNSFQGDRESGLFWLLSESMYRERLIEGIWESTESFLRDYREYFEKVGRDYKEKVKNLQGYLDFEQSIKKFWLLRVFERL